MNAETLRITEIFLSLQGETDSVGIPTVFIRLTGCPLRCVYCDSAYAFKGGEIKSIEAIMQQVADYNVKYITVTGGEPLAQTNCLSLLTRLCDEQYRVSLETSGAMAIDKVDPRVIKILDVKTPASQESHRNLYDNFKHLREHDQIKFVICDENDYNWAIQCINNYDLPSKGQILFSPSHEQMDIKQLADWIVADRLPVRMQIQLHKYIWGDEPGR